jgi:hypothetical protein
LFSRIINNSIPKVQYSLEKNGLNGFQNLTILYLEPGSIRVTAFLTYLKQSSITNDTIKQALANGDSILTLIDVNNILVTEFVPNDYYSVTLTILRDFDQSLADIQSQSFANLSNTIKSFVSKNLLEIINHLFLDFVY